jgi:hypothetical protein
LAANQITAKHEEKIDTDPAKTMHTTSQRKTHDAGVINDDYHDRERAEKIETWLTFAIAEARIDPELRERRLCLRRELMNPGI